MKTIQISKGQLATVNDEDYSYLSQFKWYFSHGYAVRYNGRDGNTQKMVRMHTEILTMYEQIREGCLIDHKDGDGLNNVRSNLRVATHSQNLQNRGRPKGNTSGYKGVSWNKITESWEAYITVRRHRIRLGYYNVPEDAAHAYDIAALDYHKEFAVLNFPDSVKLLPEPKKLQVLHSNNNSGYRGVSYRSDNGKWRMDFQHFDKRQTATFESAIEAAQEYDRLARKHLGIGARLNFPEYFDNESLNIQELVRSYYTQWIQVNKHVLPDLADCLDFMATEVSEAIELRLRRGPYFRNNPRQEIPVDEEIGIEVFDAIMMGCIALDLLGLDLKEVALKKLGYMHEKRTGSSELNYKKLSDSGNHGWKDAR